MGLLESWFGKGSKKKLEEIISFDGDFNSVVKLWSDYVSLYGVNRLNREHDIVKNQLIDKALVHVDAKPKEPLFEEYIDSDLVGIITTHEIAAGVAMNIAAKLLETAYSYGPEMAYGKKQWLSKSEDEKKNAITDFFSGVEKLSAISSYTNAGNYNASKSAGIYLSYMLDDLKETMRRQNEDYERKKENMLVINRNYVKVSAALKYRFLVQQAVDFRSDAENRNLVFEADLIGMLRQRKKEMESYFESVRSKAPEVMSECMREVVYSVQKISAGKVGGTVLSELSEKLGIVNDIVTYYRLPMPKEMKLYEERIQKIFGNYV